MENQSLTVENLKTVLAAFIEEQKLSVKDISKAIGCPVPSVGRILCDVTWPSDRLLKQSHIMMEIGFKNYQKLSDSQKEQISEKIGAVGAGGLGVGVSLAAISSMGTVAGLSGAGIVSGLAALGSLIGGGMVAGVLVTAAIPLGVAATGYGLTKFVKSQISEAKLNKETFEPVWERPKEELVEA